MDSYIEASPRGRQIFIICCIVIVTAILAAEFADSRFPVSSEDPKLSMQALLDRAFISTIMTTIYHIGFLLLAVWLTARSVKSKQWPPHGFAAPFKIKIQPIHNPAKAWAFVALLFVAKGYLLFGCWQRYFTFADLTTVILK